METDKEKVPTCTVSQILATASSASLDAEDAPICWICLDGESPSKPLTRPCKCPRFCHATCLARWQLQSAGSKKETHCDFCTQQLPNWKLTLTPACGAKEPAVMNVNFDGRMYSFEVQPGSDGYKLFTESIRKAFSLPDDSELNITFTCDEPSTGALLTLQGAGAYDAAVHCAAVSAARRQCAQDNTGSMCQRVLSHAPAASGAPTRRARSFAGSEASTGSANSSHMTSGHGSSRTASDAARAGSMNEAPSAPAPKLRRISTFGRRVRSMLLDLISLR